MVIHTTVLGKGEHHTHHRVWKDEHVFFGALMQFLALCFGETREIKVLCSQYLSRSMVASLKRDGD